MDKNKLTLRDRLLSSSLTFTLFSVLIGFIIGAIILLVAGYNPLEAYGVILSGIFSKPKYIAWTIIYATPLIITGLSITFAFRTGLFNIGAEGQFIIGALVATLTGFLLDLPPVIHVIVVFLAAAIAAGIWGGIAGYLKAKFGINEVIATIMLNWIALYLNTYVVMLPGVKRPESESSYKILDSASTMILKGWKESEAGIQWLSKHPILKDIFKAPVNWGFLIAILLAVLVWYILNKTTLGYELRAVGFNKSAAEYGGIDVKRSMVISMVIAGALAGIAGAVHVTGYMEYVSKLAAMEGYGFDGMAVSLIGGNTAFGNIFAGILFGALKYAGPNIQYALNAPAEMVNIVIGTIVFFIAIPSFVKMVLTTFLKGRGEKNVK